TVELKAHRGRQDEYPHHLPFLQNLSKLELQKPVTIIVGENGTGKSTLLEALAVQVGSILIGGEYAEEELSDALANRLKLTWTIRTRKGLFFKANAFNHFIKKIRSIKLETEEIIKGIVAEKGRNTLELMPYARTLADLERLYGKGLEYRSHGESFLDLFKSRLQANGLYILDEPEAPLSLLKQLTLISMIKEMVQENCQFIIATHSPILMSIPGAEILSIEGDQMKSLPYDDLEHVNLTRDFLNQPESFLRHL